MKIELVNLGRNVRAARRLQGISQGELTRRSGIHRTYLSDVERGQRNLGFASLVAIARGLGLKISELTRDLEPGGDSKRKPRIRSVNSAGRGNGQAKSAR